MEIEKVILLSIAKDIKIKCLRESLTKEVNDLCAENDKTLKRETENHPLNNRIIPGCLILETQYCLKIFQSNTT